jgi:RNA polymerase sigma-70 factor (ECF subfamily)
VTHHDRTLVRRLLDGDADAFDTFVDEYYPRLYRFAYPRVGRDPDCAQDVVQGTFQKVIPKLATYRGEAPLFSWLCTFCRHEISALWRDRSRREPESDLVEDAPHVRAALESLAMAEDGPADLAARRELARLVRVALDHLPLRYGAVLEWKYLDEVSVREIAGRLGISEKAAESTLTRARGAFRDGFAELSGGWR